MICRFSLILGQLQLPLLVHGGSSHNQINMTLEIIKSVPLTSLYISLAKSMGGVEPVHFCLGLSALFCKPTDTILTSPAERELSLPVPLVSYFRDSCCLEIYIYIYQQQVQPRAGARYRTDLCLSSLPTPSNIWCVGGIRLKRTSSEKNKIITKGSML